MMFLLPYIEKIEEGLSAIQYKAEPSNLYEPYKYMMSLGGKRIRPAIVLMAADIFNGDLDTILPIALSVEVFHNFSLVHDDLMDDAPLRRGKTTVFKKWNANIAVLSGDVMLVHAYQLIEQAPTDVLKETLRLFNKTAIEVCEGQQLDMDFETRNTVSISEYIEMIRLKTAVLVGASLRMGAMLAKASEKDQETLYDFGENLGLAFQLQDDLLDTYPIDKDLFGKKVGGDIASNKKTYLLLRAFEKADSTQKMELETLISEDYKGYSEGKIQKTLAVFNALNIKGETEKMVRLYSDKALEALEKVNLTSAEKEPFIKLTEFLMQRSV